MRVVLLLWNPLWIVIVQSPASGAVRVAVYWPASRPAAAAVALTLALSPLSRVMPCCRTVNVRVTGSRATTYSGRSSTVIAAYPPAYAPMTGSAKFNERVRKT